MRGDILLYRSSGSLFDRLICWRTQGPFVHVAVDLGDGTMIDSRFREGVSRHAVVYDNTLHIPLSSYTTPDRIEAGITWLESKIGDGYSVADIFDFFPGIRSLRVRVGEAHAFCCSHLVAQYLDVTGGVSLGKLDDNLNTISPNDIYRAWTRQKA